MKRKLPRRDRCALVGTRGRLLSDYSAADAWQTLCVKLEALGEKDVPKFEDLLQAIRWATIQARRH